MAILFGGARGRRPIGMILAGCVGMVVAGVARMGMRG